MTNNEELKRIESYFDTDLEIIEPEEILEVRSEWGNDYHIITREQLAALEEGKILYWTDEYGTFIKLEEK